MGSVLLFVAIVGVCGLMLWGSYKLEPHWVSKDGERVICYAQGLDQRGQSTGRWREVRITKIRADTVEVRPRRGSLMIDKHSQGSGIVGGLGGMARRQAKHRASYWKVGGATETSLRKRVVYLLEGCNDPDLPHLLIIRLPTSSRAIAMLESLAVNKRPKADKVSASTPNPETPRSAGQPDPG